MNPDLSRDSRAERPSWVYWAPELAVEATASRAADAYAAAVIFFELLTGRLPPLQGIEEKSAFELLLESKHLLITACPELDDAFVDALIGCLNTDPHRRLLYWPDLKQALTEVREPPKPSPNQSTSLLLYPGVAELDAGRSRAEKWLGLSVEPGKSVSKASALLGHGDNPAGIWSGRSPEIKGVAISLAAPAQQPKFAQTLRFVQGLGAHGSILPEDLLRPKIPKPPKMPKMGKERRKELITPRLDPTVAAGAFGANLRSPPVAQELSGSRNRALWLLLGFLSLAALLILLRIVFD
jgi:serine/threonine protein kinase